MTLFDKTINTILEDNSAGDGGTFGGGSSFGHGGDLGNSDFWNTGNSQIPYLIGTFKKNAIKKRRKRRNRKKRNRS
jgi:hypothetical protein